MIRARNSTRAYSSRISPRAVSLRSRKFRKTSPCWNSRPDQAPRPGRRHLHLERRAGRVEVQVPVEAVVDEAGRAEPAGVAERLVDGRRRLREELELELEASVADKQGVLQGVRVREISAGSASHTEAASMRHARPTGTWRPCRRARRRPHIGRRCRRRRVATGPAVTCPRGGPCGAPWRGTPSSGRSPCEE